MFGHDHDDSNNSDDEHRQDDQPADDLVKPSDSPSDDNWQHPGPPPADDDLDNEDSDKQESKDADAAKPANDKPSVEFTLGQNSSNNSSADSENDNKLADNDLIDLKQEALTKLSPLVGHLDQSPEEKFRTLMMMIQASDDETMVRQAYETALNIDDEKERARALLDIVNEINYFTQNPTKNGD